MALTAITTKDVKKKKKDVNWKKWQFLFWETPESEHKKREHTEQ